MCSFPPVLDIQVMNAIFSAQKREIPVHACVLGGKDSVFMQQAAHLTNGMYSRPEEQQHLSQFLLVCFYIHTSRVSVHILSSLFDFTSLQSPTPTSFSLSPLSLSPSPSLSLSLSLSLHPLVLVDNNDCRVEWFHFECVGLTAQPKGKWYCPECTVLKRRNLLKV
eukprot:TRINITY_DN1294_c0_g1_i10.p1 TRINITY_DN1294_c0_g1~~TRINITY_DN1294_c0_g1_i10.p1  ORF type:complete len:165 (+),score=29.07 TRINITY_DN1294_c0_g1_i10:387-881(+)